GLVTVMVGTLLDGDPKNNFFRDEDITRFNPDGLLDGATHGYLAGDHLYVTCTAGLVVINVADPTAPRIVGHAPAGTLNQPRKIAFQYLHAFVTDADGVKVFDVADPVAPKLIATVPLAAAQGLYAARTYLYVANGVEG